MQRKSLRFLLLAVWCFLPWVCADAEDWWHTPGKADVITTAGYANTLIVKIANLTPYEIELNRAQMTGYKNEEPTNLTDKYDSTALNPDEKKSFMFAPLGVPQAFPGVPAEVYSDPDYVNTTTKPYSFVLSWDDRDGNVDDSWLSWTIRDVQCKDPRCAVSTEDITLGLFLTRVDPKESLTAGDYFDMAKTVIKPLADFVKVVVTPENPKAWKNFVLDSAELGAGADQFNEQQREQDFGQNWYVAAYPFPELYSYCYNHPTDEGCYPSGSQATDAAAAEWGPGMGGWTQMEIYVTLQVRRGQQPVPEWGCYPYMSGLGTVPVAAVTVMTLDQWLLFNTTGVVDAIVAGASEPMSRPMPRSPQIRSAAQLIQTVLQQSGRQGILTLFSIIQNLNPEHRQVLRDMVAAWRAGEVLTPRQQTLLHRLAIQLRNEMRHVKEG